MKSVILVLSVCKFLKVFLPAIPIFIFEISGKPRDQSNF